MAAKGLLQGMWALGGDTVCDRCGEVCHDIICKTPYLRFGISGVWYLQLFKTAAKSKISHLQSAFSPLRPSIMSSQDHALNLAIDEAMRVLQPLFPRPKLRSRLLSKPPFRFIHDIVFAIIQSTKFPNTGLFTDAELDSSTFKNNKEAKIDFLDKLIALVNASRESPVLVESRNIVAGAQPASTLNLLVAFGKLAQDDDIDHASLIQLTARTEMAEEESMVDGSSGGTKEDFDESKVSENDIVEEAKDDNLGEVCNSESLQSMSMTDAIARIIESASIIESLFTE
eukprot:scaffold4693_cov113-Skeletonema_dohrnii-CCMP3373.AAC.4